MTFAPPRPPNGVRLDPLIEWDRYRIYPPAASDPEWRFVLSGVHTDHLLTEMEATRGSGAATPDQIRQVRLSSASNYEEFRFLFEAARLTLHLFSYFDFMYDLIVTEKVPIRKITPTRSTKYPRRARLRRPKFRFVRSIRVIRVAPAERKATHTRKWTAPRYTFAVMGHWRRLRSSRAEGKDPFGRPVTGKTWVRSHVRYQSLGPGAPLISETDPQITINIKQTLSYARDVIESYRKTQDVIESAPSDGVARSKPSKEWMTTERRKLNAALRYSVMKRDGFRCQLCGCDASTDNSVRLEVDHILPIVQWGRTIESNLRTLCRECNRGKSTRSPG